MYQVGYLALVHLVLDIEQPALEAEVCSYLCELFRCSLCALRVSKELLAYLLSDLMLRDECPQHLERTKAVAALIS